MDERQKREEGGGAGFATQMEMAPTLPSPKFLPGGGWLGGRGIDGFFFYDDSD